MTPYLDDSWRRLDRWWRSLSLPTRTLADIIEVIHAGLSAGGAQATIAEPGLARREELGPSEEFLRTIGILSAGFLFAPNWRQTFTFFSADKYDDQAYSTPYIWSDRQAGTLYRDLVHQLFLVVRDQQRYSRDREFYRDLPRPGADNHGFLAGEREFRERYGLHYCSIGEVLFVLYAWRLLQEEGRVTGKLKLSSRIRKEWQPSWDEIALPVDRWKPAEKMAWDAALNELAQRPGEEAGEEAGEVRWGDLCERLLLVESAGRRWKKTVWLDCVVKFVSAAGLLDSEIPARAGVEAIERFLQGAVTPYLQRLAGSGIPSSPLRLLEAEARFPILPYFFWVALDRAPKTYLVCPVWTSPRYPVPLVPDDQSTPIVGLALCAVAPQTALDATLPSNGSAPREARSSDPRDLMELLALLARPAVELNFYGHLHEELLKLRRREATAAIMTRNLSHNIGSHAIANPQLIAAFKLQEDPEYKRLTSFLQYLQMRLDFIARALNPQREPPQPLFLLGDILNSLLMQSALLTTIVSDLGFEGKNIAVQLARLTGGGWCSIILRADSDADDARSGSFADCLLAIPGGVVGCHALYSLIENILRNSAKYGERRETQQELILTIRLQELPSGHGRDRACYELRIRDNLSTDRRGAFIVNLRDGLDQSIIDSSGKLTSTSHGLQEMKTCARMLAGPLRYAGDELPMTDGQSPKNSLPVWCEIVEEQCWIEYKLLLQKPLLLGIVDLDERGERVPPPDDSEAKSFDSIAELADSGAYFGVLLQSKEVAPSSFSISAALAEVTKHHAALPYRLMVVVASSERETLWRRAISTRTQSEKLPVRRIHVVHDATLAHALTTTGNAAHWRERILGLYEAWIRVFKGVPQDGWNLCIGFERGIDQIAPRWLKLFSQFRSELARIFIVSLNESVLSSLEEAGAFDRGRLKARYGESPLSFLLFDNHNNTLGDLRSLGTPAFCHAFSGSTLSLYQSLEMPPTGSFSAPFFIYSLLESSLTRIAILDERVAEAVIEDGHIGGTRLTDLQGSLVFPLFSLAFSGDYSINESAPSRQYVSRPVALAMAKSSWKRSGDALEEGLQLSDAPVKVVSLREIERQLDCFDLEAIDALVIHEGTIVVLCGDRWRPEHEEALLTKVPALYRTSGSGSGARVLGRQRELPFLEFSVVSDSTYQSLNKFQLARAVLAARANSPKSGSGHA